jgi:uncharacterized phage protein (TIGR01671 family)
MENEIKFRAWDKQSNKMFEVVGIDFNDLEVSYTTKGIVKGGKKEEDWNDLIEVEIMQFTGLTDKNDKDIYEGDILESEYNGNHSVVFRDGAFCIKHVNEADWSRGCCKPWRGRNLSEQCNLEEVIGNIYENPELIK